MSLSGTRGVQVGDHNIQNNVFFPPPALHVRAENCRQERSREGTRAGSRRTGNMTGSARSLKAMSAHGPAAATDAATAWRSG